jgi:hypothetical protein
LTQKLASGWFWQVPAALDLVQPALTDQAVSAAEAQLGVKLPAAYLELLRKQNGGPLRATWPATYSRVLWGIGPQAPSITCDQARFRPRHREPRHWAPAGSELLIPFDGDGDWFLCFDYRKLGAREEPAVTLLDCECEFEEPLAETFLTFLAGLVDQVATSQRIYGEVTAEGVARALAQQLGAPAPRLDNGASGYASWRIALRGDHQWCWVSANAVPVGFRRAGATDQIVMTEETGLQIPEDPACVALISSTGDARAAVAAGITALGLSVVPL